jgi:hypothetical protein
MKNILRFPNALVLVPTPFTILKTAHVDVDRNARLEEKVEEQTKVVETLKQNDCTVVGGIDYVPNIGFEAENIKCNDVQEYDVFLDNNFSLTFRREDLD